MTTRSLKQHLPKLISRLFSAVAALAILTASVFTASTPALAAGTNPTPQPNKPTLSNRVFMPVINTAGQAATVAKGKPRYAVTGSTCAPSCDLWAETGTMPQASLPGSPLAGTPVFGYNSTNAAVTAPGGPVLIATQGTAVTITLHNANLPSATSLSISGTPMVSDVVGVTAGSNTIYSFPATGATALTPGTYLYEAGLTSDGPRQAAMGLYGALVVRPASCGAALTCAYDANSAYDDEYLLVLSEIDPAFNLAPATYDTTVFAAKYWLINGKVYPNTDAIFTDVSRKVLLRYVNAGLLHHSMTLAGLHQTVYAVDAQTKNNPMKVVAQTIPTGSTMDAIVTMPATVNASYALFEAAMHLDNLGASTGGVINFGGMLTFVTTKNPTTIPGGPVTTNVVLSPNPSNGSAPVTLTAAITAPTGTVTAAEYFVDTIGANGAGTALTGAFGTATVTGATASLTVVQLAALSSGDHTFYVHGYDGTTWGAVSSAVLNLDKTGPSISNMGLTPNPDNGTADVAVQATASDVVTGNQNVTTAEYFIDPAGTPTPGTGTAMALNNVATISSLTVTIPAATVLALTEGNHTVAVRALDALGNWGAFGTLTLTVDKTPPGTSGVVANPNPNNGSLGIQITSGGAFYVRIDATVTDPITAGVHSNIVAAEYFFDTVGANGSGGAMIPTDGSFDQPSEAVFGAVDMIHIASLAEGTHTIYVHGKDAAGNWGLMATNTLVIDKTAPTLSSVTVAPSPTNGSATITAIVTAADNAGGTGLNGGEYWIDASATHIAFPGTTSPITVAGINVSALTSGNHNLNVRVIDAAGNFSAVFTRLFTVVLNNPTAGVAFGGVVRSGASATLVQRTTSLTITLTNPNGTPITGVTFTDALPQPASGTLTVVVGTPVSTCGGAVTLLNTNRSLSLAGGTIPASGSCTVTVSVRISTGATTGPLTNTIPVGGVTTTNAGGNLVAVSAVLTVNP